MWDMFLFDVRRTLRSRNYWYLLFGWSLISLLITGIAYGVSLHSGDEARLLEEQMESVFHALVVGQGILVLLLVPSIAEGNLAPEFTRKTQENLFLTALSARTILLGKWLMVGAVAGLLLLTSLPAGLFACRISGLPVSHYVISMFLLICGALMTCSFTFRRLASEHHQPQVIPHSDSPTPKKQSSSSWDVNPLVLAGIGVFAWFASHGGGGEVMLPVYAFSPPLASVVASKTVQFGSVSLPFWIVGGVMTLSMAFFMVIAGAQWLGDWKGRTYRLLRNCGFVWTLTMVSLHAYLLGAAFVHSDLDAARYGRILLYAVLVFYCYFCHYWICSFGLPLRADEEWQRGRWRFLKRQPLSGSLQEWVTFILMPVLILAGIYLGSGWLPSWDVLLGWLIYFAGFGLFLVAWASRTAWGVAGYPVFGQPHSSSLFVWVRISVGTAISLAMQLVMAFIFVGIVTRIFVSAHPVITVIANGIYYLMPIYPLMASAAPFYYQLYGGILFLVGLWLIHGIQTRYKRSLAEQAASAVQAAQMSGNSHTSLF